MATTDTYTLTNFIADLDRITREESAAHRITARTAPLLARLVRDPSSIPAQYLASPAGQRGRYMLHRAPKFNVTSVVWRPGDRAIAHNHETWGVIGVIDNGASRQKLEVTSVRRHRPGAVSCLVPGDEVHAMYNPTARDTIEIHVYGKDLAGLARRRWDDDGTEKPLVSDKYLNC